MAAALFFYAPLFSQETTCGTMVDPVAALQHEERIANDLAAFTKSFLKNEQFRKAQVSVVPVQFHIVRENGGSGGVNYASIQNELEIVNDRFAPDLQFAECGEVDYINSTAYYTLSSFNEGHTMSFDHNEPDVLNVYYVGDANGFCGWANFSGSLPRDYIVLDNACATNTSTLAHEIGHYFDLYHTHEGSFGSECVDGSNCAVAGDRHCDTPADPVLSGDVNASCEYTGTDLDNCNFEPYDPDVTNIMSYSRKACRSYFSPEQRARVVFTANNGRSYLRYDCSPLTIPNSGVFCDLNLDIPNNACGTDTLKAHIRVDNEPASELGEDARVSSVDVIIDHFRISDIEMRLVSPSGVEVLLSSNNGGTGNDYGNPTNCPFTTARFTMSATDSVSVFYNVNSNISGEYVPEGNLDDFNDGSDPNGIWQLQACDSESGQAGTLEYVKINFEILPPANDEVCNAMPVDVGTPFGARGQLATAQMGEIDPGIGTSQFGCEAQDGWCDFDPEPSIQNSVWFTFIAPPSGQVDILMDTDDDTQFALWSVSDCNDFSTFVEIAANDDSGLLGYSSFIEKACVVPGEVYHLQVDGFNGAPYNMEVTVVEMGTPLVLICPSDTTVTCEIGAGPDYTGEAIGIANECCSMASSMIYSDDTTSITCPGQYTLTRKWAIIYDCSFMPTCEQVIIVNDEMPPLLICPADVSIDCGMDYSPAATGMASATDNCSTANTSFEDEIMDGACTHSFFIKRKWMTADECGQQSICEQMISVNDSAPPLLTCPNDLTVSCENGTSTDLTGMADATDNCGISNTDFTDVVIDGNCPNEYSITRTWTVSDGCNAPVSCEQTITVVDVTLPQINCPMDMTVSCENDLSNIPTGEATGFDNCGAVVIASLDETIGGGCPNDYSIKRTWTATDGCLNQGECEQMIFVNDNNVPTISCPDNVVLTCGEDTSPMSTGMADGTDLCSSVAIVSNDEITMGNCVSQKIITRTWTATDECDNQSTCTQTIQLEDQQPPVLTCQTSIEVSPSANGSYDFSQMEIEQLGAGSMDNCGAASFSISQSHFTCNDEGAQVVDLIGTDECGNAATCPINVIVLPFLQLENSDHTDVSCAGKTDGEIMLSASASGGQVEYSIDEGDNFQTDGHFTNLGTGTYNVLVTVSGITEVCEITETIEITALSAGSTWFEDADGDGYHGGVSAQSCDSIPGYSTVALVGDCDDGNAAIYPNAPEICDGLDNDCDGQIPPEELDTDADGHRICDGDCDDSNDAIFLNAPEICDGLDNDCDGQIPAEELDTDADGFRVCGGDCDDTNDAIFPNAMEICDGLDNDCDGQIPAEELDTDSDGFRPCEGDCDDTNDTIFPNATEICDGLDNDCDGTLLPEETDADMDGHFLCIDDCDDNDAAIYPNAPEVCDGKDNDCDGITDDGTLETFIGDVVFQSQAELDAWLPCFNIIDGNVTIFGTDIDTLGPLSNIIEITGTLTILSNDLLYSLGGLDNLLTVGDSLAIYFNAGLSDCCPIDSLLEIGGVANDILINDNEPTSNCNSDTSIMDNCPMVLSVGNLDDLRDRQLFLFPNPTRGEVTAVFHRTGKGAIIQVRDLLGRIVFSEMLMAGTEQVTVDLRKAGALDGVYFVSVFDGVGVVTGEVVVMRE